MMLKTKVMLELNYEERRILKEAQAILGQIYDLCDKAVVPENLIRETNEIYWWANDAYYDIEAILGYIPEDYT